jgi:predicted DCC family thiol-disulfide oxidoreductase YuxK
MRDMPRRHLVLWDGDCGVCGRAIQWLEMHDRRHRFETMAFQQCPSPPMTPELRQACQEALHVLTVDGQVLRAGRACVFIIRVLGWRNAARVLSIPPFAFATEIGYRLVASNRRHISRAFGWEACALPLSSTSPSAVDEP